MREMSKQKMPLFTEVQIKPDFDVCGSACLLLVYSQSYKLTFMNCSACLQTSELDCLCILFTWLERSVGGFHRAACALRGCGVLLQHCSALQPASEPPLPPCRALPSTTPHTHTHTHHAPGAGIMARMHNLPWATKAVHTHVHRHAQAYILHFTPTQTHT